MTHLVVHSLDLDKRLATARRYLQRERAYLNEYVPATDSPVPIRCQRMVRLSSQLTRERPSEPKATHAT